MSNFKSDYAKIYRKAYNYHEQYRHARSESDWGEAADALKQFNGNTFEQELAKAIYAEIERDNKKT